ncbi:DUF2732 family protein [Pectobacterium carotovorum]|uniref:DUF2732 family protein n=3 Tax=Pectobacterium TaxID=122277 RepID=A0AAP9LBN2_9GAMM|nr:DUF2732 family protein [Pectobacterium versatile]QHQ22844.1 DUF2732 family protein [Pectobacterium parvum]QLL92402.1 DUF2732 family protein [Pectobacterium carotovorum]GKX44550.1 hypothetical protein SOASR015_35840 [Pectobacterium carotovorum subsp. carotovorum]MBQ4785835.1 DUF2732 family protein [Pectobacterium versatile]
MHMYKTVGQEIRRKAESEGVQLMLSQARNEAKADAHVSFSCRLNDLATHVSIHELSNLEIIELLRQEADTFYHSRLDIQAVM